MTERTQGQRVIAQADVEALMVRLDGEIERYVAELDDLATGKAEARYEYEVAFSQSRRTAAGMEGLGKGGYKSVDEREDFARCETADLYRLYLNAEALYDAHKKGLDATRDRLSAQQTLVRVISDLTGTSR